MKIWNTTKPSKDSEEIVYLHERRKELGGYLPERLTQAEPLPLPDKSIFDSLYRGTSGNPISTTMAFVRALSTLTKDKQIGKNIVPIVPDEARTFGMESLFRQLGIYSSSGQLYEPEDSGKVLWYREDKKGQILQEGINECGAFSSWLAAGTAYSNHSLNMVPMYIYYSMFGFQRIGDLAWAAGDLQARGFLFGATSGRTTLAGEGLQHQDGHSHILASTIPNCISYDPTYAYELAVILHHGLDRMMHRQENVFFYITLMNENYQHPSLPEGVEDDIIHGLYLFKKAGKKLKLKAQSADSSIKNLKVDLMGCGSIFTEIVQASEILEQDWGISANLFSATSFNELTREGYRYERERKLNPETTLPKPHLNQILDQHADGKVLIAASDYVRQYAEQIRFMIQDKSYWVLGTDGFGCSDMRKNLRDLFEVDAKHIVYATLFALVEKKYLDPSVLIEAKKRYQIESGKRNPLIA